GLRFIVVRGKRSDLVPGNRSRELQQHALLVGNVVEVHRLLLLSGAAAAARASPHDGHRSRKLRRIVSNVPASPSNSAARACPTTRKARRSWKVQSAVARTSAPSRAPPPTAPWDRRRAAARPATRPGRGGARAPGPLPPAGGPPHSPPSPPGGWGGPCPATMTCGTTSRPRTGAFEMITANPAAFTGSVSLLTGGIPAVFRATSITVDAVMKVHAAGLSIWIPYRGFW